MCSFEGGYTSEGSAEHYSGISEVLLTQMHQNNGRGLLKEKRKTFTEEVIAPGCDHPP